MLGPILMIPFFLFGMGIVEFVPFLGVLIFAVYLILIILNFELGFLTLIFIRSSLDIIKGGGSAGLNIAALVSVALIVLGCFYVLYRKVNILRFEDTLPFLLFL